MAKFKAGDLVEVLNTANIRSWNQGKKAIGLRFNIQAKELPGPYFTDMNNTYMINYTGTDLKLIKMAKKKADESIVVVEGDYFTATYKRKKIRGIVGNPDNGWGDGLTLFNNQAGDDLKCDDNNESGFSHGVSIDGEGTLADLKAAGVNNYTVLKDRRQKAVIDKDKLPEISVSSSDFRVSVEGDKFVIGCGAVELTKKQIEGYLRFRENKEDLGVYENKYIEDMELDDIEEYVRIKKTLEKGDGALYKQVIDAADEEGYDEDDVNDIDEDDIKALFKYATHVAAGVK